MVHGLIGIVLRCAAPLKLLNYKLTRRSRSTASVIRFATLESRLSRFSRPCKVVSRTTIFPQISRHEFDALKITRPIIFLSFLIYYSPLQMKFASLPGRRRDEQYYSNRRYERENQVCTRVSCLSCLSIILLLLLAT